MPGSSPCSLCQIYYWEADGQNETEKMKVLFLPETTVKLKNLSSHTSYLVSVSAFNAAGDGPRSGPRQGRTHQAGRRTACSFRSPSRMLPLGATTRSPPPRGLFCDPLCSPCPRLCPSCHPDPREAGTSGFDSQGAPGPGLGPVPGAAG